MSDFDDMFRKGLYDHEAEVPGDLWSRIDQEVNPKKSYTKLYIIGLIGLLIGAAVLYVYLSSPTSDERTNDKIDLVQEIKATVDPQDALRDFLLASTDNEIAASEAKPTKESAMLVDKVDTKNNKVARILSDASRIDQDKDKESSIATSLVATSEDEKQGEHFEVGLSLANSSVRNELNMESLGRLTDLNPIEIETLPLQFDWALNAMPEYDKKCPKFGNSKTGYFSVEAYHSSDMISKKLTPKTNEYENYAAIRRDSESQLYSFSNGLGITWHSSQGIGVGLGVERSQINELFSFVEQDAREVRVLISIDTLFNTDGTYSTSTDTTRIDLLGVKKNYVSNQYTSIDLPISLSYRWDRKRWGVGVRGAVYLNLLFSQKGRVLGLNGKPAWISEGSDNELDAYRAKSGLKFDGSIDVSYHLTHAWDIYLQPYFRYNGNTLTRDSYQLDHFVNTMGVRAGIRYNFGF